MPLNEIPFGGEIRSQPLNENFQYLDQKSDDTQQDLNNHKGEIASQTQLGHVKVGNNLTIDPDGTLNAIGGNTIVESGSNENGNYIRFSDGTQICTHWKDAIRFDSKEMRAVWIYPAGFLSLPIVSANRTSVGSITPSEDMIGQMRTSVATYQCRTSVFRISGMTDWGVDDFFRIDFIAIGRWK